VLVDPLKPLPIATSRPFCNNLSPASTAFYFRKRTTIFAAVFVTLFLNQGLGFDDCGGNWLPITGH
jgi:hypothetical protein